jgi:putative ABC transport system ATP-binding protein
MELMTALHRGGSTIVMVTHEDEIAAYAQRIIRFLDGRVDIDKLNGNRA